MHPNVNCSTVCNSQDMEATYLSIVRGMDKEDVVYKHIYIYKIYIYEYYSDIKNRNNFLLSLSNVICHLLLLSFAGTWMDLETAILSEGNQTEKEKYHMVSLICGI